MVQTVESWDQEEEKRIGVELVAQMKFEIHRMYMFYKEESVNVDVDLV